MKLGQQFRSILPLTLRAKIPIPEKPLASPTGKHERKMLTLPICRGRWIFEGGCS